MTLLSNHPVEIIYKCSSQPIYGTTIGVCRITGKQATGIPFEKWVKKTFTDYAYLLPGNIISNAAAFCFDESSAELQNKTNRDKPQRFRTYSHVIDKDGSWHALTKANKQFIYNMVCDGASLVSLTDSGQKHLLFKHRPGMWQLDELFIIPDIKTLRFLHSQMTKLTDAGFSQTEVISGHFLSYRIANAGLNFWKTIEDCIKSFRGKPIFAFSSWLLFTKSDTE